MARLDTAYPPTAQGSGEPGQTAPVEISALGKITWSAFMQLVGLVASWALSLYLFGTMFSSTYYLNLPPNPTPQDVSNALGPIFQSLVLVVPVALGIQLVAMLLLTLAFRNLGGVDHPRFYVPSVLMILMMIGFVLIGVAAVPFIQDLPGVIAQAPTTPGGTPSAGFTSLLGSFLVELGLLAIGGLLALIGLIGGQILGLWRVGTRYDESVLKVGAIFAIIPLLNIVSPVLVLVGAYQVKSRLTVK